MCFLSRRFIIQVSGCVFCGGFLGEHLMSLYFKTIISFHSRIHVIRYPSHLTWPSTPKRNASSSLDFFQTPTYSQIPQDTPNLSDSSPSCFQLKVSIPDLPPDNSPSGLPQDNSPPDLTQDNAMLGSLVSRLHIFSLYAR
jgi:hypothetical protein